MEAAKRASLAEEEVHQMRAGELATAESSSRTVEIEGDSAIVAEETTEGVQITEEEGSGELDPPACRSSALCTTGFLNLPL